LCDLSIIIVSWNVWPILAGCLRSIEQVSREIAGERTLRQFGPTKTPGAPPPATLEVIVVDNASADQTAEYLPRTFPWVRFIASGENLGFTRGNNRGYAESRGRFVYFLNPDTELDHAATQRLATPHLQPTPSASSLAPGQPVSPGHPTSQGQATLPGQPAAPPMGSGVHSALPPPHDSLWTLYAAIADAPGIGMVGPQLRYADGSQQVSVRRFPSVLTGFFESTWLGRAWRSNPWARQMHMADWPVTYRHDADWLVGAAMLCRRTALEAVRTSEGPFDERFFMYSEELDLCRRLRLEEWRVVYVPEAVVIHYEGKSSDQASAARHIHFNTSKVQYYAKWYDEPWPELLRRYLLLEFRVQTSIERAKLLLHRNPELRRRRIAAYQQVIASRLRP
jgi:GT2 family glycosyltransferase